MAGMELSGEAGAAGRKTASWGRTWVKGFSTTVINSGCSYKVKNQEVGSPESALFILFLLL